LAVGIGYIDRHKAKDFVIVMDADHEDDPAYIPLFFEECAKQGARAIVFGERTRRSESLLFRAFYRVYTGIFHAVTGQPIKFGNYCIVTAEAAHRIASLPELWNHFAAAILKSKVRVAMIPTKRGRRHAGDSKMNFVSLVAHAFNGFAVFAETVAVRLIVFAAALTCFIGLVGAALVVARLFTSLGVMGWTSTMIALLGVVLIQVLTTVVLVLFVVLSMKGQRPMIPGADFEPFIDSVTTIVPGDKAEAA
jgi:hypothetical protein